jgi:hypothetical protein
MTQFGLGHGIKGVITGKRKTETEREREQERERERMEILYKRVIKVIALPRQAPLTTTL